MATAALSGCGDGATGSAHDSHENHGNHATHETHAQGIIVIDNDKAKQLGIVTTEVKPEILKIPLKLSGEVIYNTANQGTVSAPMSGRITYDKGITEGVSVSRGTRIGRITTAGMAGGDQLQAARIEYEAAKKEVERLAPLVNEGLVTVGEYNRAAAELERARNNMGLGSGSIVTSPISGTITSLPIGEGGYVNQGDAIATVSGNGAMTLRVDIPADMLREAADAPVIKVKFPQYDSMIEATAATSHGNASTIPGYASRYYSLPPLQDILPGSYADAYIPTSTSKEMIAIPLSAITEQMGQHMVYVKEPDEDHYRSVPVTLGASDGVNVEVTGIKTGDLVVTEGVTFVRLAENAGNVPPSHTHNH